MIRTKKNPKTECFECVSHKPGRDGYPRARVDGVLLAVMYLVSASTIRRVKTGRTWGDA